MGFSDFYYKSLDSSISLLLKFVCCEVLSTAKGNVNDDRLIHDVRRKRNKR